MHRIDGPGATVDNKFTDGDPVGGIQATLVTDDWLNDVQEELISILAAGGVAPVKGAQNQVLQAIRAISGGIVGVARGVKMSVVAASATATLTADEVAVKTSLGGQAWLIPNFNKTINLGTTGAGGMDTGAAPTSGFVALYAIYNPATGTSALLGRDATAVKAPEVYGGANMPAGFTASALVSVWPTNTSGQLKVGFQTDRSVAFPMVQVLSTSAAQASATSLSVASAVPRNARSTGGYVVVVDSVAASVVITFVVAGDVALSGASTFGLGLTSSSGMQTTSNFSCQLAGPQTIFYTLMVSTGDPGICTINLTSYTF